MARGSRGEGRLERALSEAEQSVAVVEDLRTKVASHALRTSFLSDGYSRYFLLVELFARLHPAEARPGYDARAFEASERARARTFVDSLEEAAAGIGAGVEPSLLTEERSLRDRLNEAAREQLLLPSERASRQSELQREIDSLAADYDDVQARIRSRSPRYAALTQPATPSLPEVQARLLDEDTRVLVYALGPDKSFLWSVTRDRRSLFELPPGPEIEETAKRVHRVTLVRGKLGRGEADLEKLRDLLLGPVVDLESTRRLLVVTEGALNYPAFRRAPASLGGASRHHDGGRAASLGLRPPTAPGGSADDERTRAGHSSSRTPCTSATTRDSPPKRARLAARSHSNRAPVSR